MLKLKELAGYDTVVLQCHNNPDVDTIASGYALARYFEGEGVPTRLVYGGFNQITKPNITEFVRILNIPLEYIGKDTIAVAELAPGAKRPLLITVDCQHGAGNVMLLKADTVCVIDHHLQEKELPPLHLLEPYLGSCATVVWRLLRGAEVEVNRDKKVATALYYGLFTDTNSLSEIFHPFDRDMLEQLDFDPAVIKWLKNNNLTRDEIIIAGTALIQAHYDDKLGTNLFQTEPCDPNILGFINDLTLQVQGVLVCVGFCEINGGVKLSIRSATGDVMANELAAWLTEGLGSGGGNREKAGGFMRPVPGQTAMDTLRTRLRDYFDTFDKMVAGEYKADLSTMKRYAKKAVPVGYVELADLFPTGTDVLLRTLEGDATFKVSEDTYAMVGIKGEVYPIDRAKFEKSYRRLDGPFHFLPELAGDAFYEPTAKDRLYERNTVLTPYIKPCVAKEESIIYARPLEKNTKVFAKWYSEGYMFGRPGDMLAARAEDTADIYVIDRDIFERTYQPV